MRRLLPQVRIAASEGEVRALQHANATLHDDLQRAQGAMLAVQHQLQQEQQARYAGSPSE